MVMQADLYSFWLLTLILGVGSTKANQEGDSEDEGLEVTTESTWMKLLNKSGKVYSLKPLEEVLDMKANKHNIGCACRHIMWQAWGEYYLIVKFYSLSLILVIQPNQAGS